MNAATDKPLTRHFKPGPEPPSLAEYQRGGGFSGLRRALTELSPEQLKQQLKTSGLRGRGGAGFLTGVKAGFVPSGDDAPRRRYLVANADEMEPGTNKDRYLIEGNPHQLIEGMILTAYAIGANCAYIFLRWAYKRSARLLHQAIAEARAAGLLGRDILGSGFDLELMLHQSAGRYICGEETALLNALEGRRAIPRAKPPFPPAVGLFGRPTIVQNVETLCNVPPIAEHGAEWYQQLGLGSEGGTKIYGVSGKVKRPGLWELPMGTSARELVFDYAAGMRDGCSFRAALPGGASTAFLSEAQLDTPMDFESVQRAGSRLGTGTMIVLDDQTCPVGCIHNLIRFFAQESCGFCTPCREGLPWAERILAAIEAGRGRPEDLELLHHHCRFLESGFTHCALAPGAVAPLASGLDLFAADFERHLTDGRCPWER
jgi:NADH-quinone oxidoreductase subunit F